MLIQNNLPPKYKNSIRYVYNYFKDFNQGGQESVHYWVNDISHNELKFHLERIRNAPEMKASIAQFYKGHLIEPSHQSDEVYLSVSPTSRKGSDIALSDCHYDAPFQYVHQGGCRFLRLILALNHNQDVFTEVGGVKSLLSTGDYNVLDYNADYQCVHGSIPKARDRLLLKLHFVVVPPGTNKRWVHFCKSINNWWTHFSREMMRDAISPQSAGAHTKKYLVLAARWLWNNFYVVSSMLVAIVVVLYVCVCIFCRRELQSPPAH